MQRFEGVVRPVQMMKRVVTSLLLVVAVGGCTAHSIPGPVAQNSDARPAVSSESGAVRSTGALATTFAVLPAPATCGRDMVEAGTAGSAREPLAGCDGTVGSPVAPKLIPAAVGEPVYMQLGTGQGPFRFTVSPASAALVNRSHDHSVAGRKPNSHRDQRSVLRIRPSIRPPTNILHPHDDPSCKGLNWSGR